MGGEKLEIAIEIFNSFKNDNIKWCLLKESARTMYSGYMCIKRLLGGNLIVSIHVIPLGKLLGLSVCFSALERDDKSQQLTAIQTKPASIVTIMTAHHCSSQRNYVIVFSLGFKFL